MKAGLIALTASVSLCGCGEQPSAKAETETVAGDCLERFSGVLAAVAPAPDSPVAIRYLFDSARMNAEARAALIRNGPEGTTPMTVSACNGSGCAGLQQRDIGELMNGRSPPASVYFIGHRPLLVYSPRRNFTAAEARQHLGRMCAMSSRGLDLLRVSVSLRDRSG